MVRAQPFGISPGADLGAYSSVRICGFKNVTGGRALPSGAQTPNLSVPHRHGIRLRRPDTNVLIRCKTYIQRHIPCQEIP